MNPVSDYVKLDVINKKAWETFKKTERSYSQFSAVLDISDMVSGYVNSSRNFTSQILRGYDEPSL